MSLYTPVDGTPGALAFVGFDNYTYAFERYDGALKVALANSIRFLAIIMCVGNPIALLLAALLSSRIRWGALYRTILFLPTLLSVVIAGWVWQLMLNPLWGLINKMLVGVGLEAIIPTTGWLGTPGVALIVVALVATWQFLGLSMILFLAALISIDDELLDAARVDGASWWSIFWQIRFPLILPEIGLVVILTVILNFPAFDIQQVMGGRNAFLMANLFYYNFARSRTDAAVIGGIMFAIVGAISLIYFAFFQKRLNRVR